MFDQQHDYSCPIVTTTKSNSNNDDGMNYDQNDEREGEVEECNEEQLDNMLKAQHEK